MMKILCSICVVLLSVFLLGCTTAGPFVSNISSNGDGSMVIEKSRVKLNFWTNGLETCDTTSSTVRIISKE